MLDHGGNDDIAAIRARGRLDRDTGNAAIITALKRANAKKGPSCKTAISDARRLARITSWFEAQHLPSSS
jgi:hypothetical protein